MSEDQEKVTASGTVEAEIEERAARIEDRTDAGIPAAAELEGSSAVAESADIAPVADRLDEAIAKGMAAYDGYPDSDAMMKTEYLRTAKHQAAGLSQASRDLLADTILYTLPGVR